METIKRNILEISAQLKNGTIDIKTAQNELFNLLSNPFISLIDAKKGDYLKCTKVFAASKKYTVGKLYRIINIEMVQHILGYKEPCIVLRDNNNKLTRINQLNGISFTDFDVIRNTNNQ
jgi:hypothetical protein